MAKILLVDDDPCQLRLRMLVFQSAGHDVIAAAGAAEALNLLASGKPDIVVTDLRLPNVKEGAALIRRIHAQSPKTRLAVLSGYTEDLADLAEREMVHEVIKKPVRSEKLLATIAKLAIWLICIFPVAAAQLGDAQPKSDYPFQLDASAEVVADLDLSAPGADWGRPGRESVLAIVTLNGASQQHVMLYAGGQRRVYSVFLGPLEPGAHQVRIERHPDHSARGVNLQIHAVKFRQFKPADADYAVVANAPAVFARPNTLRKFSDIPLLTYCERLGDGSLRYSVIFSNEDGGTSTRALMARWGRVTDIEHVYQVWLDKVGNPIKSLIQTRDHKDVEFRGKRDGLHPLLGVVTDNNMVADDARSAVRYQIAPLTVNLGKASREQVMDENPLTYQISARELEREGRIRKFGMVEGTHISAPENYLFVEMHAAMKDARLAVLVRMEGDAFFRSSNLGVHDMALERSGWMRTALELPPATQPPQVAEIGLQCLAEARTDGSGVCRVDAINKLFFLDASQVPGANFFFPRMDRGPWTIPAGQVRTIALRPPR